MAISLSFSVNDLLKALGASKAEDIAQGGLDGAECWFEYLTQQDDRVRPSHAALHGTRWRADDPDAPTPPLDYGCRCFIRYIAAPGSDAAEVLPEASGDLSNRTDAYGQYLDREHDGWRTIAKAASGMRATSRFQFILGELQDDGMSLTLAREIAGMILAII